MAKKLQFLADESLEYTLILHIRQQGFDIQAISETLSSISDEEILEIAIREKRVILTNDKDFGDLVFLHKL